MFTNVVTSSRSAGIRSGLTYESDNTTLRPGSLVRVPLRRSIVEGIVTEILEKREETAYDLKQIKEVLGEQPLLTNAQLKTARWVAEYYMTDMRHALSVFLPPPPWKTLLPNEVSGYRLGRRVSGVGTVAIRGQKQQYVAEFMNGKNWVSEKELREETGTSVATLKGLVAKGLLVSERQREQPEGHAVMNAASFIKEMPPLTPLQLKLYEEIKCDRRPSLLFGITGSGKTHIYMQLIADAIRSGGQAIVLVPEILLSEHAFDQFERGFDRRIVSILHSRLKPAERRREWKRIHSGEVGLVIGSRSAIFAPLNNLKLIIIDEEHEWTYKNEQAPRYHARETAEELARNAKAKLILGTATPSVESWSRSKAGVYHLAHLPERYQRQALPTVRIIDLADVRFGKLYPFSPPLLEAIAERLKKQEQSILFLNRRGSASALLCLDCRRRVVSPESQLPFTVHTGPDGKLILIDHTSGIRAPVPALCPHCSSVRLYAVGAGTERIEQILKTQFPSARLLRADSDVLQDPLQMRALLSTMKKGEADILLGTQMVTKGLDLPEVTLAAVLVADVGLSLPHFRAGERIWQMLTQLTGRSGRRKDGEVIIQTFRPDAPEVRHAAAHTSEEFLDQELKLRIAAGYPPATKMIRLLVRGPSAEHRARALQNLLQKRTGSTDRISCSASIFSGGKTWQILMRGNELKSMLAAIDLSDVSIDIDPIETI